MSHRDRALLRGNMLAAVFPGQPQDAVLLGAALATIGWLYAARRARSLSKKQLTFNTVLSGATNELLRRDRMESAKFVRGQRPLPEAGSEELVRLGPSFERLLNYYEFIAGGVRRGDLDEAIVKDTWRALIVDTFSHLRPFIVDARRERNRPELFRDLEWLCARWTCSRMRIIDIIEAVRGRPLAQS